MPLNLLRVASGPSTTISAEEVISQKLSRADSLQEVHHLVPVVTMIATSLGGDDYNGRSTTYCHIPPIFPLPYCGERARFVRHNNTITYWKLRVQYCSVNHLSDFHRQLRDTFSCGRCAASMRCYRWYQRNSEVHNPHTYSDVERQSL